MSEFEALLLGSRIPSPVAAPTFWCMTCQMSLRSQDERLAHAKLFPAHRLKQVERLICPSCGNVVPLEDGAFPEHWVGGSANTRRCNGSRKRA